MIEYNSKVWFRHIINFRQSDTFRVLLPEMFIVGAYTGLVGFIEIQYLRETAEPSSGINSALKNTTVMHSILGFVLSLLLVFRTNSAYDRWWEGRKLWGMLVNVSRNLAIKINTLVPTDDQANRDYFRLMIPNYCFSLKEHLRKNPTIENLIDVDGLFEKLSDADHHPNMIIQEMYRRIKTLADDGSIRAEEQWLIDQELRKFADIQGGCERILNTPIPFSYNIFLKKFIFFYILTLPIGFVAYFDYWAIPISIFVFYVLVSLEIIAEEIEDPFGVDPNDLPTDKLSGKIRANVDEIFEN